MKQDIAGSDPTEQYTKQYTGRGLKGLKNPMIEGEVLLNRQQISFLGDLDVETGECINPDLDIVERNISNKVLVFPSGAGSTVGSYSIINMALNGTAPLAIIVNHSDPVILIGCCVADIPHIHCFDVDITKKLRTGVRVGINSETGTINIIPELK